MIRRGDAGIVSSVLTLWLHYLLLAGPVWVSLPYSGVQLQNFACVISASGIAASCWLLPGYTLMLFAGAC